MINFYKNSTTEVYVLGEETTGFSNPGQFYSSTHGDHLAIYNASTGEKRFDSPYTEYLKENGSPYLSLAELVSDTALFFKPTVSTGGGSTTVDGYTMYTDSVTGTKFRVGMRNSQLQVDKALTATGFDGAENTDWENVSGFN